MKSINPYFMLMVEITRYRVPVSFLRHCMVKGGIKYTNLFRLNKYFFCHFYSKEISGIVQRGKWKYIFYFFFNRWSDKSGCRKIFPSMNNAMPDSSNFRR